MAKKIKGKTDSEKEPVGYGDFIIVNHEKLDRAINGTVTSRGSMEGGVGKNATQEQILAEYDRLGGLIKTKDGRKVATGSFWDFEKKAARETPLVEIAPVLNPTGAPKVSIQNVGDLEKPKRGRKAKIEEE